MKNDCAASAALHCWLFLRYLPSSWLLFVSHPRGRPWLWFREQEKRQTASGYNLPWNLAWASVSNKHCRLSLSSRPWYTDRTSDVFNTINHGAWSVQTPLPAHLFGDLPPLSAREHQTWWSTSLWFRFTLKNLIWVLILLNIIPSVYVVNQIRSQPTFFPLWMSCFTWKYLLVCFLEIKPVANGILC